MSPRDPLRVALWTGGLGIAAFTAALLPDATALAMRATAGPFATLAAIIQLTRHGCSALPQVQRRPATANPTNPDQYWPRTGSHVPVFAKILSQPTEGAPDLAQRNRVYPVTAVLPTPPYDRAHSIRSINTDLGRPS